MRVYQIRTTQTNGWACETDFGVVVWEATEDPSQGRMSHYGSMSALRAHFGAHALELREGVGSGAVLKGVHQMAHAALEVARQLGRPVATEHSDGTSAVQRTTIRW